MASLSVRRLTKRFGPVEVLKSVDLEVETGEFVVLVGPSGCGKSTLLAMIAGLETVTEGEIRIGDRLVNTMPPKDRNIAMVFQSYALYPTMTVRENITFGMESRNVPKAERDAAVARVSSLLHIDMLLNRRPGQLSGGQRQRVAMGRALVRDPQLFLFDEPLSNLDAKLRVEMRTEIKKLHQGLGKTTVYVTHDQVEAMTLASRIAVLHQGAVQQFAEPRTVYDRPANMFVASFMGSPAMNFLPAEIVADNGRPAAQLSAANGSQARLPLSADWARAVSTGQKVVVGIRPESIGPHLHNGIASGAEVRTLEAVIDVVEPTGAQTMVLVRVGDREVITTFPSDATPKIGEKASLAIDMRKVCLFDPSSEHLLQR
ncbi:MAG TPA: ABC transporter ATP-binding protein [Magnetospirillaceae bacterium]|jgi:multiple sugar transport system ATP-binding protein